MAQEGCRRKGVARGAGEVIIGVPGDWQPGASASMGAHCSLRRPSLGVG
jgi:hypothetical protein